MSNEQFQLSSYSPIVSSSEWGKNHPCPLCLQQPYKELVSLSGLQTPGAGGVVIHQTPATVLCNAQVETCLGPPAPPPNRPGPTLPDVTLAISAAAEPADQLVLQLKKPVLMTPPPAQQQQQQLLPQVVVLEPPDVANSAERKQPDGEDVLIFKVKQQTEEVEQQVLATNGMLDRISHDLDYLLNRTKDDA